ncbi:phosphoglycolate phosphatase-like HAD superfamily hydrolase [Murinocardiopsis flavida]|uniref:Phosphoglycolate phosphatase-like HAD superfamily hydrolase n=1 Tax=Murinocardiopsis flavida TaxID=645275 RepID=A0A2P8DIX1_9ACTN|nr:phosphoglycolate phosphatase-like HAD superfamily hydrolase [Murinocardiopsis flavida]
MLWNIDLTLVDVARVTRAACAEAFETVTGQPLVYLAATSGLSDSEIFFEFLARNDVDGEPDYDQLPDFIEALGDAFARRRDQLTATGRAMPGALEALQGVAGMENTVQSVVTGSIMPNAVAKLAAFGMDGYLDLSIGGFGSEHYPKASMIQFTRMRAEEARKTSFPESRTVYITDAVRDVEAAIIGRATPIGVLGGSATESQLRAAGARHVLPDLTDVEALFAAVRAATGGVAAPAEPDDHHLTEPLAHLRRPASDRTAEMPPVAAPAAPSAAAASADSSDERTAELPHLGPDGGEDQKTAEMPPVTPPAEPPAPQSTEDRTRPLPYRGPEDGATGA